MTSDLDCTTCGACCISPFLGKGYIQLDVEEETRLTAKGLPVLVIIDEPDSDRMTLLGTRNSANGRQACIAWEGLLGVQCTCSIYADRPSLCREFEAGSPECHDARKAVGIE